jgi:hypothetical protein
MLGPPLHSKLNPNYRREDEGFCSPLTDVIPDAGLYLHVRMGDTGLPSSFSAAFYSLLSAMLEFAMQCIV